MPCKVCGNTKGRITKKVVKDMFKTPQEVLSINCTKCGNLMYGNCKNKEG